MRGYKDKTDGSYIEEKESSILWNYENTDFEFGQLQAKELQNYIQNVFEHLPIEVIQGNRQVIVVPKDLNKQRLIRVLIEKEITKCRSEDQKDFDIDFILCIGDDC